MLHSHLNFKEGLLYSHTSVQYIPHEESSRPQEESAAVITCECRPRISIYIVQTIHTSAIWQQVSTYIFSPPHRERVPVWWDGNELIHLSTVDGTGIFPTCVLFFWSMMNFLYSAHCTQCIWEAKTVVCVLMRPDIFTPTLWSIMLETPGQNGGRGDCWIEREWDRERREDKKKATMNYLSISRRGLGDPIHIAVVPPQKLGSKRARRVLFSVIKSAVTDTFILYYVRMKGLFAGVEGDGVGPVRHGWLYV